MHVRPIRLVVLLTATSLFPLSLPAGAYLGESALELDGVAGNYVEIPHHPSLNPTAALTLEAWVRISDGSDCTSILGKAYSETYWLGVCGNRLRSYLGGAGTNYTAGDITDHVWTHVAVSFDGTTRRHFIDGVEVAAHDGVAAPLPTNSEPVRIGSDVDFDFPPSGWIDEVRLWSVARTAAEIVAAKDAPITSAQPGLVSVWGFDGDPLDAVGDNGGVVVGGATFSPGLRLDLLGGRFQVDMSWKSAVDDGVARPIRLTDNTGTFYYLNPANYEVMLKVINGCALNGRYWVFVAGLTNVGLEITVTDTLTDTVQVYENPLGTAFAPVQDTNAFAGCV